MMRLRTRERRALQNRKGAVLLLGNEGKGIRVGTEEIAQDLRASQLLQRAWVQFSVLEDLSPSSGLHGAHSYMEASHEDRNKSAPRRQKQADL